MANTTDAAIVAKWKGVYFSHPGERGVAFRQLIAIAERALAQPPPAPERSTDNVPQSGRGPGRRKVAGSNPAVVHTASELREQLATGRISATECALRALDLADQERRRAETLRAKGIEVTEAWAAAVERAEQAEARVAKLEQTLTAERRAEAQRVARDVKRIAEAEAERDALQEQLLKFGSHTHDCAGEPPATEGACAWHCACGYFDAKGKALGLCPCPTAAGATEDPHG